MSLDNPNNQTPQPTPAAQTPQQNTNQQVSSQTPVSNVAQTQKAAPVQPAGQQAPAQPTQPGQTMATGAVQAPPPSMPERIRRDFSFAQVLASVFSTVTCMVLAPKIGLLGGLLGAVIGAVVAAVASQVYKSILYNTSDKIKYKRALILAHVRHKDTKQCKDTNQKNEESTLGGHMKEMAEHTLLNTMEVAAHMTEESPSSSSTSTPTTATPVETGVSSQPTNTAEESEQKTHIWRYILVIAGVTMLSVALSVGIIDYITKGEGWGKKPEVVYITRYITSNDNPAPASSQQTTPSNTADTTTDSNQTDQSTQKDTSTTSDTTNQKTPANQEQESQNTQSPSNTEKTPSDKEQPTAQGEQGENTHKTPQAANEAQDSTKNS